MTPLKKAELKQKRIMPETPAYSRGANNWSQEIVAISRDRKTHGPYRRLFLAGYVLFAQVVNIGRGSDRIWFRSCNPQDYLAGSLM